MGEACFPHRNSSPIVRGVWCGLMKMQYHKTCCKKFENSQTKSAMRIVIRMVLMMNMWATRIMIMMVLDLKAKHIKDVMSTVRF
jgi:hypothetical protein